MNLLANTITADMGLIPGLALVGPALGLPLSVMAALIERPFYARAGVRRHTLWFSFQANLVSLGVGFVAPLAFACVSSVLRFHYAVFTVWPFCAVVVSVVVERWYLLRRTRSNVEWGWTATGNILSASVCVGVLVLYGWLRMNYPHWRHVVAPYYEWLQLLTFGGSAVTFAAAFVMPRRRSTDQTVDDADNDRRRETPTSEPQDTAGRAD